MLKFNTSSSNSAKLKLHATDLINSVYLHYFNYRWDICLLHILNYKKDFQPSQSKRWS